MDKELKKAIKDLNTKLDKQVEDQIEREEFHYHKVFEILKNNEHNIRAIFYQVLKTQKNKKLKKLVEEFKKELDEADKINIYLEK